MLSMHPRPLSRLLLSATLLATALSLGACASRPTRQQMGTVTGAVVGGVTGAVLTGSPVGTVAGAAAGALVGSELTRRH